jgi:hypothetical protein
MKVALIFWGLTRSLKYTHISIKKNILEILKKKNINYEIFMHTYKVSNTYTNHRAKEKKIKLDFDQYKLLNINNFIWDNLEDVKKNINFESYRKRGDPWSNSGSKDFQTLDNFILSLYSKNKITQEFKSKLEKFDYVIYLRPDVLYVKPIDVSLFKLIKKNIGLIPNFHHNNGYNDRMFISNNKNAIKYGSFYKELLNYSKKKIAFSEKFNKDMLTQYNIKIKLIDFPFRRVRANGKYIDKAIGKISVDFEKYGLKREGSGGKSKLIILV